MGVHTSLGTNALFNTASIRMKDPNYRISNSRKTNFIMNGKMADQDIPIKILNVLKMSDDKFCAHSSAHHCDYLFRFTNRPNEDQVNIFEYPVVSCVKSKFDEEKFKIKIDRLNRLFRKDQYQLFSDQENFMRRKFNIKPVQLNLTNRGDEQFLSNRNQIYADRIFACEIVNFPVYLGPLMFKFLNILMDECAEDALLDFMKLNDYSFDDQTTQNDQQTTLSNLNGLFLTKVAYNQTDVNVDELKFNLF